MAIKAKDISCDIVVVGAGLVGLAAVIALAAQGKRVVLVDSKRNDAGQTKAWDTRIYALTPATENWLQSLGVWSLVDQARVNDVEAMALWNPESETPLHLSAEDANLTKLACIIENNNLLQALWQKVETLDVQIVIGSPCSRVDYADDSVVLSLENGVSIKATLLVAADGANSFVRQQLAIATKTKDFNQAAIVVNYLAEQSHGDVARQWFAAHSTLALLPLPDKHVSMVWSVSTGLAGELLGLSGLQLSERVKMASHDVLGVLKPVSEALSFTLRQTTADSLIGERVVLVGDAAHQVHPMAGQGANLGFRDVIALQALIAGSHHMDDIGEEVFLRQYERVRRADILSMNMLTSGLDSWFSKESDVLKKMTVWGMRQLDKHRIFKKILVKQAVS
ncbi:MAG: ubiquinone biosynthesis protein UbiH [Methylophilaceae bacterium]|nr:MAG: ubiquinone biosynthesis protein UbiH [Methylophilaceae bacterium]